MWPIKAPTLAPASSLSTDAFDGDRSDVRPPLSLAAAGNGVATGL
jgi:hypothetical protein